MNIVEKFKKQWSDIVGTAMQFADDAKNYSECLLSDGSTKVYIDGELKEASPIFVVDQQGVKAPAPDGDLVLEDGTTLTVKGGLIEKVVLLGDENTEVQEDEVNLEAAAEAKPEGEVEVKVEDKPEDVNLSVEDRLKNLEDMLSKILDLVKDEKSKTSDLEAKALAMSEQIQKFSEEPVKEIRTVDVSKMTAAQKYLQSKK